jgi:hypothetical protein
VDFVGWHREGRVAGAVIGLGPGAPPDMKRRLTERVSNAFASQLPKEQQQLRVRVVRLGGKASH